MTLTGVTMTVNYPETSVDAAIPAEMKPATLAFYIEKLMREEPDATSFTIAAVIKKSK
jgi:hypothetical protein